MLIRKNVLKTLIKFTGGEYDYLHIDYAKGLIEATDAYSAVRYHFKPVENGKVFDLNIHFIDNFIKGCKGNPYLLLEDGVLETVNVAFNGLLGFPTTEHLYTPHDNETGVMGYYQSKYIKLVETLSNEIKSNPTFRLPPNVHSHLQIKIAECEVIIMPKRICTFNKFK